MKRIPLILLTFVVLYAGCATSLKRPSPEAIAAARFDALPAEIETLVKAQYTNILKDPYSAVYRFGAPKRVYFQGPNNSRLFGTAIPVHVNAKNSYGGYTGGELNYWAWSQGSLYNLTNSVRFGGVVFLDR